MPWTVADVEKHNKSIKSEDKPKWVEIANAVRADCLKGGGTEQMCDALAVATANKQIKESSMDPGEIFETIASLDEATWSAKFINDLPDSSFLHIEKGGEKDNEGRTTPRSLRHFPVRDAQGEVDLPHLRNALARIPQSNLPESVKDKCVKAARALAKKHLPSYQEAEEIESDVVPLEEKAVDGDGNALVKIISPGWGTSGYYSPQVLERDAGVYRAGTHMYWDHPTATEAKERPERSLRDLAGELVEDGRYITDGPTGPGVYAKAKVFGSYRGAVEELAPHIGTSHRASGVRKYGEAEGKKGHIIEKLTSAASVDFVTQPGRGGEIVQLFEAARERAALEIEWSSVDLDGLKRNRPDVVEALRSEMRSAVYGEKEKLEEERMDAEDKAKELEENIATLESEKASLESEKSERDDEIARLKETIVLRESRDFVSGKVGESDLPDITKSRLVESISKHPVLGEDGTLDTDKYSQKIDEAIKVEKEYIAKLTGTGDGKVKGMGSTDSGDGKSRLRESLMDGFLLEGKTPEEAEKFTELFMRGR